MRTVFASWQVKIPTRIFKSVFVTAGFQANTLLKFFNVSQPVDYKCRIPDRSGCINRKDPGRWAQNECALHCSVDTLEVMQINIAECDSFKCRKLATNLQKNIYVTDFKGAYYSLKEMDAGLINVYFILWRIIVMNKCCYENMCLLAKKCNLFYCNN